jgi:RimJ/RimL family protein N-acetyltransferase
MPPVINELGQPLDFPVNNWTGARFPAFEVLEGRYCRLEPFAPSVHARDLWDSLSLEPSGASWTYLPEGPFADYQQFLAWIESVTKRDNLVLYAIITPETGKTVGMACYHRIDTHAGSIEVGYLNFSPLLQRTKGATEAMFLMMQHAFELGFRRYEWKCHTLNAPSRRAALRLGFTFEGIFRQAAVVKGHNRDTAWFSVIDTEWPALKLAFEKWLSPENFDSEGRQIQSLESYRTN